MKKFLSRTAVLAVISAAALNLVSCVTTAGSSSRAIELPEDPVTAAHRIVAYEKSDTYLYTFTAINYGDAVCNVKIYDDKYMKVTYPQTGTSLYYYYKFTGDYLDKTLSNDRLGIFGYAVGITVAEVDEIVFRNPIHGGYKFKSISDQMHNDKKYASGNITWNTFPAARQPDVWYFLEFFEKQDKKLSSKTDEAGNKKDIARRLFCAISEKPGFYGTWSGETEARQEATAETDTSESTTEITAQTEEKQ